MVSNSVSLWRVLTHGVIGSLLLCGSACTLPDVKIGSAERSPDAGSDEQAVSESGRSGTSAGGAGGDAGVVSDVAVAANGGKGGSRASAGSGGKASGGSRAGSDAAEGGEDDAEPGVNAANRKWRAPAVIDLGADKNYSFGLDADGRVVAVWEAMDSDGINTYATRYLDAAWTSPVKVAGPSSASFLQGTSLRMDPSGQAFVLTLHQAPPASLISSDVYVTRMSAEGTWGTPTFLGRKGIPSAELVVGASGAALAGATRIESSETKANWTLWTSLYTPDLGWGALRPVLEVSATSEDDSARIADANDWPTAVALAIDRNESETVAWRRDSGMYAVDLPRGSITALDEFRTGVTGGDLALGSDDYGRTFAMWTRKQGDRVSLYARRYIRGVGWDSLTALESNDDADAEKPSLHVDKEGNAMVVWSQSDSTTSVIWYNRYELDSGWSGPQRVEPKNPQSNALSPQVAMDDTGNVLAVWDDLGVIRASRYVLDRGWEPAVRVSQEDKTASIRSLDVSRSGLGMVTWTTGTDERWFSRFE